MLTPASLYTSKFPNGKGGTGGIGGGVGSRSPFSIGGGPSGSFVPPGVTFSMSFEGQQTPNLKYPTHLEPVELADLVEEVEIGSAVASFFFELLVLLDQLLHQQGTQILLQSWAIAIL